MSRYIGLYAIIAIGAAVVIASGGIDLSIGSLMGLTGVLVPMLIRPNQGNSFIDWTVDVPVALALIAGLSLFVGWTHGMLITKLRLQPFLVTLCGLFVYRGLALTITQEQSKGFGTEFVELRKLANGEFLGMPLPILIAIGIAAVVSILMHRTVPGRQLLAIGRNEEAARFSGINTDRRKILAYMICSLLAGFGGMLFAFDSNSAAPNDHCNGFELYAIAGAVLGGCSLRGGEISLAGVLAGTALMQVSADAVFFLDVPNSAKLAVIGLMVLIGVIADEFLRRASAKRRVTE
jgi:ribose transport system permease protein